MNVIVAQLVTKFSNFYGIRSFSIVFTRAREVRELCLTIRNVLCDGLLAHAQSLSWMIIAWLFGTAYSTYLLPPSMSVGAVCPIHNLRTRQAVVTEDPLNTAYMINGQMKYHMPLHRTIFSVLMKRKGKFRDIAIATSFLLCTKMA
jgi:hypothetical protein